MTAFTPAMRFENSEEVKSARPLRPEKASIVYFIRAGSSKPLCFDSIYESTRDGKIVLSLYSTPEWSIPDDCIIISGGLSKYHAFYKIREFLDFEFAFLLDYDIGLDSFSEDRLLRKLQHRSINCAQFAISQVSHSAFPFLGKETNRDFRRVNFIEVMAPIFSRQGIDKVLHTFPMSISTWGLDYAWSSIFSGNSMYVIDTETMHHTSKPDLSDGPFYRYLSSIGVNPREELANLKEQFNGTRLFIGSIPPVIDGHLYGKIKWAFNYYKSKLHIL